MSRLPGLPIAGPVSNSALRGRLSLVQHDSGRAGRVRREKGEISARLPSPRSAGNVKRPCHHQRSLYFRRSRPFPSGACLAGGTKHIRARGPGAPRDGDLPRRAKRNGVEQVEIRRGRGRDTMRTGGLDGLPHGRRHDRCSGNLHDFAKLRQAG